MAEAVKNPEQVAPQAVEVATLPAPAAPTTRRKNPEAVVEVDASSCSLQGHHLKKAFFGTIVEDIFFKKYQSIFPACRCTLDQSTWGRVLAELDESVPPQDFPDFLDLISDHIPLPNFISDLARVEWGWRHLNENPDTIKEPTQFLAVNPSLSLIPVSWKNLFSFGEGTLKASDKTPDPAPTHVMIWRHAGTGSPHIREAEDIDLLALKIVTDDIDPRQAAESGNVKIKDIHSAINRAIGQGLLFSPPSRIHRTSFPVNPAAGYLDAFTSAETFTLQWHVTQACDLHCKHCYDRSDRSTLKFSDAIRILYDFYEFCRQMNVKGKISFTGGNPLLYPNFLDLYQASADLGFGLAILGNPSPEHQLKRIIEIAKPLYFQISLEGLEDHNDYVRGKGHFKRSLDFLDVLRKLDVFSMVMLTLTRANIDQVLSLGAMLKDRADYFTFNRLSTVGEGAQLSLPLKVDFENFLRTYEAVSANSQLIGIKDNLFNIIREEKNKNPFGGCTGYGCGAAFNFVALLPDGEVHACRKFPSPLGNIFDTPMLDIYHSEQARKFRKGPEQCKDCRLSLVCRGCLANIYSHGLDIFKDKDPFCFISEF